MNASDARLGRTSDLLAFGFEDFEQDRWACPVCRGDGRVLERDPDDFLDLLNKYRGRGYVFVGRGGCWCMMGPNAL